jgi:hypothetical protein
MTQERQQTYPLRMSDSVKRAAVTYAKKDKTSLNHFIEMAVAEKVSRLETEEFFTGRRAGADMEAFWRFMNREGSEAPQAGDEMPEGIPFAEKLAELRNNPPKRGRRAAAQEEYAR